MKRVTIVGIGILALIAGVQQAAAQQYGSVPSQTYGQAFQGSNRPLEVRGPVRVGVECLVTIDSTRGYGFMKPCDPPKRQARR
jgi:hypothetical protein